MEGQEKRMESRTPWRVVVMIALAVAAVYWLMDTRSTLWDRDEPRFARATMEMVESGNYLYPTFNGRLRPDKPILVYWLMSMPLRVLGPTSLACRFFSGVGIAVTCVLTFQLGRRFLGVRAGLWSMMILGSTLMVMVIGTAATSDAILLPTMVAVVVLFTRGITSARAAPSVIAAQSSPVAAEMSHGAGGGWNMVIMGLAFGLGLLAKGPVALLPIPVIGATLWLSRRNGIRVGSALGQLAAGIGAGVLLFLVWAIPANSATGGEFLRLGVGHHVLARSARPLEHHGGSFLLHLPYYLPVIVAGFFPWTLHLPGAVSAVLGRRVGAKHFRELFLAWMVSIVVIMTLVATKLPHYILFTWPAMALAVAGVLAAEQGTLADMDRRWLRGGVWFFGPVAGGAAVGLIAAPFFLHLPGAMLSFWLAAAVLVATSVLAIRQQLHDRPQASAVTLLAGMLVLLLPVMLGIMPALERVKISPALASAVRDKTSPDVPVSAFQFREPSLNFYIGRRIESLNGIEAVVQWAGQPGAAVLIIPGETLAEIEQHHGSLGLQEIASKQGLNYSKGNMLEVAALLRHGQASGQRGNPSE